jgi:hypothetical protein
MRYDSYFSFEGKAAAVKQAVPNTGLRVGKRRAV